MQQQSILNKIAVKVKYRYKVKVKYYQNLNSYGGHGSAYSYTKLNPCIFSHQRCLHQQHGLICRYFCSLSWSPVFHVLNSCSRIYPQGVGGNGFCPLGEVSWSYM